MKELNIAKQKEPLLDDYIASSTGEKNYERKTSKTWRKSMKNKFLIFALMLITMTIMLGGTVFAAPSCTNCHSSSTHYDGSNSSVHYVACDSCGNTDQYSHSFSWVNDSTTDHAWKCSACGRVNQYEAHYDNNGDGNCDVCGRNIGAVDTTPPTATGITFDTYYSNTGKVRATAQGVTDNSSGVARVQWYMKDSADQYIFTNQVSNGQWYKDIDCSALQEGIYKVGIVIHDNAGNYNDTTYQTTSLIGWKEFYYDKTGPTSAGTFIDPKPRYTNAADGTTFRVHCQGAADAISRSWCLLPLG